MANINKLIKDPCFMLLICVGYANFNDAFCVFEGVNFVNLSWVSCVYSSLMGKCNYFVYVTKN